MKAFWQGHEPGPRYGGRDWAWPGLKDRRSHDAHVGPYLIGHGEDIQDWLK